MRAYKVVDVFTTQPLLGNPVAVILDAEGLDAVRMQAIARWTNLSETTFLLAPTSPGADYKLRIFTPFSELPFAGHPTLGSAHAALEAGRSAARDGELVQECGVGLVRIAIEGERKDRRLTFALPQPAFEPLGPDDVAELAAALGRSVSLRPAPAMVNVGPIWIVAELSDARATLDLAPDYGRIAALGRRIGATGVTVFGAWSEGEAAIEVRSFAPSCGVNEDPVCGSGNGAVAAYRLRARGNAIQRESYLAAQGRCVGREGRVFVNMEPDGRIFVGGSCVTAAEGALSVD